MENKSINVLVGTVARLRSVSFPLNIYYIQTLPPTLARTYFPIQRAVTPPKLARKLFHCNFACRGYYAVSRFFQYTYIYIHDCSHLNFSQRNNEHFSGVIARCSLWLMGPDISTGELFLNLGVPRDGEAS